MATSSGADLAFKCKYWVYTRFLLIWTSNARYVKHQGTLKLQYVGNALLDAVGSKALKVSLLNVDLYLISHCDCGDIRDYFDFMYKNVPRWSDSDQAVIAALFKTVTL